MDTAVRVESSVKAYYRRATYQERRSNVVKLELMVKNKGEHFLKACGQNLTQVPYNEIFKNGEGITRVLVEGGAGLGKSIFCVSVTRAWSKDVYFQEYDLLLCLPLGQQKIASASSVQDLIKKLPMKVNSRDVEKYLQKKNGDGVLLVADGWNELDESKRQPGSFFYKLLFGDLFSSLSVIVTSRPTASALFHRDECTAIHRFIEICGFDKENMKNYVQSELAITRHAGVDSLLNKMEYNPLLERLCRIPLSCSVVCKLWHTLNRIIDSGVTKLCSNVMLNILSSNCQRQMPGNPMNISNLAEIDRLPQNLREAWWQLCEIAFQSISSRSIFTSQLSSNQVGIMMYYGFVEFNYTKDEVRSDVSLNFVYPTSQEYLAALHFVKQPPVNQLKSLDTIKVTCKEFPMFWRYLFGPSARSKVLLGAVRALVTVEPPKCILCQCAFEAKNVSITSEVIECLSDKVERETIIRFSGPSSQLDYDAMMYIMSNVRNSKCKEIIKMEINFSSCALSVPQIHTLADALASAPKNMTVKDLDLSDNNLGDESVAHLFTKAASSFVSLKKLFIAKNNLGESGLTAVIKVLAKSSSRTVTQLDLSSNSLTLTGLWAFNRAIKSGVLANLKILFMRECFTSNVSVTAEYFIDLANILLEHCVHLRRLDLHGNYLGKSATPMVNVVIKKLSKSLDLIVNREYISEVDNTFVGIMEDTVKDKGTIDHTVVHGVIVGPGRSGKNSLMNRLMHQGPFDQDTISPSTGVLESVKKVEVKKFCTVAAAVSDLLWRPLDYDEEALELIMVTAKCHTASDEAAPLSTDMEKSKSNDVVEDDKSAVKDDKNMYVLTEETDSTETGEQSEILRLTEGHIVQITSDGERHIAISEDVISSERPLDMFKRAVKLRRMDALREHLESSWTLYLTNTGGQIEFQEHLPLLVCGPSVFFVTFPLNQSLDEHYTVYYQHKDGSHKQYPSPSTLMQEILQLLATIAALDCTGPCSDINLKPKVFFVGTHRDQLPESCVHDRIQQIDKQLQDVVRQTSLFRQESIEFAIGKEQMIFTVNNLSKDDKDFEKIRLGLQKAVERGKEFTITCPSTWLIFSLILRAKHESSRVLSYYDCLVIAERCGITDGMELNKALLFIHSTLGLVRYYCVDKLNELVIIDPQIFFDTFTTLLTEMFTDSNATVNEIEKFKERGIISKKVIERIRCKRCAPDTKSLLPLGWLLDLLVHLRIAARFMINKEECFFFPSTLFNAPVKDKFNNIDSIANEPPPLQIAFEGGFCPRGIPGALITYLMTSADEVTINSRYSWELHSSRVFKNQVSFSVGPCDIILKISCTHVEVLFDPESGISKPSDVVTTCEEAFTQLQEAMNTVTKGFRGCKYYFAFNCTRHECRERLHPAAIDWSIMMVKCKLTERRGCLPRNYHIWFPKEKEGISQWLDHVIDFGNKSAKHLGQIADTMTEWEGKIAEELQLTVSDVAAIKTKHPMDLKLQTRAALGMWKQRLGDNATYNNLIHSFELAGCQQLADTVRKFEPDIESMDRNLSIDSITSPQNPSPPPPPQPVFPITAPTVLLELEGQGAVDRLEEKNSDIQKRLLAELNKNSKLSPEDLVNSLTLLPIALRTEYQKFIPENLQALQRADSITSVFHHISPLLSFIDYSLLAHLVKEHGSEQLQGEMATYAHLVEDFLGVTTVEQLADYWPGRQDTPPHFEKLTAVVSGDPGTYTLRELDSLRRKFCRETNLTETVLVLIGVGVKNSFAISWIVPSIFIPILKSVIGRLKSFCQREQILSVTLSEQQIYPAEAQLQDASERANQFDRLYTNLHDQLKRAEEADSKQELIHSEVEAVKQQVEDHKEVMKSLAYLDNQIDELGGWGQLLIKDCVKDRDVVQHRVDELRARWDALNSNSTARLSLLEESLLSLGHLEEAYDELWVWLTDALQHLENTEPITGDPDLVEEQLSKHKTLLKQLGSRLSSKNAVTRAGKLLMRGKDRMVLKKKLQDLDREWEKVCQLSVERQDKLENAYIKIGQFRSLLGPLQSWIAKFTASLNESEPVHGDLGTVQGMVVTHIAFQKDLGNHKKNVDAANASGKLLIEEVLDYPAVTQQDLRELNEAWENICQLSVGRQEKLDKALHDITEFEEGYSNLVDWIEAKSTELQTLLPTDEDMSVLQQQIEDHKKLSQEFTGRQPQYDKVNSDGQNVLQLAHPAAVPVLQSKLQHLGRKWVDLRRHMGARSEALASALLEFHGLQDMLEKLRAWVSEAEERMSQTEAMPISNDMEVLEQQLATHEAFQEEMATNQPNMDALNKTAKKQKTNNPNANPEMAKRISNLYKHWQKLWFRSSERHRQLLEARSRLKDFALARSFNFDNWRKRFNGWVDQQKLRVNDLFRRFDGNHDGMLTREEFMKALRASGLAMNQIELEKIADFFDKDRNGIDLSEILRVLIGDKRGKYVVHEAAMTDAQKIENEIQIQVSKCTCANRFRVTQVAGGQYRFGDSQKLRLVRILRSTVMVRVGGGWEPFEEFLHKHDPCRASGRTNQVLRQLLHEKKSGLTITPRQTATSASPRHVHTAAKRGTGNRGGTTQAGASSATQQKITSTPRTSKGETAAAGAKQPTTPTGLHVGTPSVQRSSRTPIPKTSKIPAKH